MRMTVPKLIVLSIMILGGAEFAPAAEAADFSGTTISVGTFSGPGVAAAQRVAAATWEKDTGGKINIVEAPVSQLFPIYLTALVTGDAAFDVITMAPSWLPDFSPYLSEMPADLIDAEAWADIHPIYREMMTWDGKRLSQTIEGEQFALYYRADLFGDAAEMAAFKAQFGYQLAAPRSWDQYYDIAAFFTRPEAGLWGTAETFFRGGEQAWYFISHAASFANHPETPGALFFDPETFAPQIDNPGWAKALEDYTRSVQFSPPGALNFDAADVRGALGAGRVAMAIARNGPRELAAIVAASDAALGVALLPGSERIWNHRAGAWTTFGEPVRSPFLAFGGWLAAVPEASRNKAAAWHYLRWLAGGDAALMLAPYRFSQLSDADRWLAVVPQDALTQQYLDVHRAALDAPNIALDMRLPAYEIYTDLLEIGLSRALAGDISPAAALDTIARQWDELSDKFGRDEQRAAYRASMGLPPL